MTERKLEMLIDGARCGASDGGRFESVDPGHGEVWARCPRRQAGGCGPRRARRPPRLTEGPWARMTPPSGAAACAASADLLAERSEALGRIETRDTGKIFAETRWQARYIAEFYHFFAGAADKVAGETLPIDKPDMFVFTGASRWASSPRWCRGTASCSSRR